MKKIDVFLVLGFSLFILTSAFIDSVFALGISLRFDSSNFLAKWIYILYADQTDNLLIRMPLFLQIQTFISAFIFGPFYGFLVYAIIKRKNWIRIPSLLYASAMIYGMTIVFGVEFFGEDRPGNYFKFLVCTLPYLIMPIVLAIRMAKPNPFKTILI